MAAVTAEGIAGGDGNFSGVELADSVFGTLGSYSVPVRQSLWDAASSGDLQTFGAAFTAEVEEYVKAVAKESHWGAIEVITELLMAVNAVHGSSGLREVMSVVEYLEAQRD